MQTYINKNKITILNYGEKEFDIENFSWYIDFESFESNINFTDKTISLNVNIQLSTNAVNKLCLNYTVPLPDNFTPQTIINNLLLLDNFKNSTAIA